MGDPDREVPLGACTLENNYSCRSKWTGGRGVGGENEGWSGMVGGDQGKL